MWRFRIDEDVPRSTAAALRSAGHTADDVRDVGLRGGSDKEVFAFAQAQGAILVTADKGFASELYFRPGTHAGIIILRLPNEEPTQLVNRELLRASSDMEGQALKGLLVIVEVGRTRVRRHPRST